MKKIIIIGIITVITSISYYFISFLPSQKIEKSKQERQTFLFNKQTECKNICEKIYQDEKNSLTDDKIMILDPQYSYNENKNACFYSGGHLDSGIEYLNKKIINCQTNEEVLAYRELNNKVFTYSCDTCVNSIEEYKLRSKEYILK